MIKKKKKNKHITARQYLVNLTLGLIVLFGLYWVLAWFSYSPLDSSWAVSSTQQQAINKMGWLGAALVDLCLVMFGDIGNVIPFLFLIVPLYLFKTKLKLNTKTLLIHIIGFCLLFCGLSVLATFLLSHSIYHLRGGVLGSSLVTNFYPIMGQFWLILTALISTIIGFILCSGTLLIHHIIGFYYWISMKNRPESNSQAEEGEDIHDLDEVEEIIIKPTYLDAVENEVDRHSELAQESSNGKIDDVQNTEYSETSETVDAVATTSGIQISGLNSLSSSHSVSVANQQGSNENHLFNNGEFVIEQELPQVSISPSAVTHASPVQQPTDYTDNFHVDNLQPQDVTTYQDKYPNEHQNANEENLIPKVSLSNLSTASAEPEQDEHHDLARQFAMREEQRLLDMKDQAKKLGIEESLSAILGMPEEDGMEDSIEDKKENEYKPENDKESAVEISPQSSYKPYSNSLIHPAFQQKSEPLVKPSTPLPSIDLLEQRATKVQEITQDEIHDTSLRIEQQLSNFNVKAKVKEVLVGPVVTRYELELQPGVKASKVSSIDTDLARALMFRSIRVAEVIPGKPYIGIETPNIQRQIVPLRDVLDSEEFRQSKSLLSMALGKDISGKPVIVDLAKMPHLLVAGSTGSGKSVGVNTMILSLLFRVKPEEVKFIMIDPKVVELSIYNDIPHLLTEVVTDMKKAANALRWCVDEMERRYQLLSALRVRNIEGFNEKIEEYNSLGMPVPNPIWRPGDTMDTLPPSLEKLSYIVVIVDEFADLMMVAGKQIEELIARLAQKARAVGIHLILATQRPSVDVITGLIKANIPSRIAFTVVSKIDSRTILDQTGAEALLGRGDMLYSGQGSSDLIRIHGAFMDDNEVARVADDWKARGKPNYIEGILDNAAEEEDDDFADNSGELDQLFDEVMEFVINTGNTSTSSVQRRFRIGFNRAARIMDQLQEQGIVSALQNGKREILARKNEY